MKAEARHAQASRTQLPAPAAWIVSLRDEYSLSIAQLEVDEGDIAIMKQREKEPLLGLDEVMKKYGQR